jgi:pilus assembly protein CpaB
MRSGRSIVTTVVILLAGLLAAVMAFRWLEMQSQAARAAAVPKISVSKVAVLSADVRVGRELTATVVKMLEWPTASLPEGAIGKMDDAVGRSARVSLYKGEPVLESKLNPKGARGGLSAVISPGKRAISVAVNDVVGMSGAALEGTRVDILVNATDGVDNERQRNISKIVLERVLVLAVSEGGQGGRVNAVTVEVSPAEAEKLDLARSVGTLSLMLRSQSEEDSAVTRGATKEALFGASPKPPVVNPVPVSPPVAMTPPAPKAVIVREPVKPSPSPVAAPPPIPTPPRTCVDALVGSERRTECF